MKSAALALSILLMISFLAACGEGAAPAAPAETDPVSETAPGEGGTGATDTDARVPYDTLGIDYGGYTFRVWNYDAYTEGTWDRNAIPEDLYAESLTGEVLNDAVFNRNKAVEEALDITIYVEDRIGGDMSEGVRKAVTAGSDDVDLIFPRQYDFAGMVTGAYLLDLASLDSISRGAGWWNGKANDAMIIRGKSFGMYSDISYFDKLSTIVTFFNQKLAADYQLGDMYELVGNNQWTMDRLLEIGAPLSADINGDGAYDMSDSYPLACQNDAVYYFLHGANLRICTVDSGGSVVFSLDDQTTVSVLQKIYDIMADSTKFLNRQSFNATLYDAINMFCENRNMFLVRPLQSLFQMRNMEADFGILPTPKMLENQQSYGTAVNPYAGTIMSMPMSVADPERSAKIADVLAWESHYTVIDPLYENVLGNKLIRDEGAKKMLTIVFDSVVCDVGVIFNFADITSTIISYKQNDVVSMIEKQKSKVEAQIDKLNEVIDGI